MAGTAPKLWRSPRHWVGGAGMAAGLDVDNGILVDRRSATSCPFVYAAGDVANQPGFFGGRARLETFHNAAAQAEAAATEPNVT